MDNPKVSIIVPIYRVEEYIERCAESLFAQTFDDIEYIFVDDCSPDKSVEILQRTLEKYPHRKRLTRIERLSSNSGQASPLGCFFSLYRFKTTPTSGGSPFGGGGRPPGGGPGSHDKGFNWPLVITRFIAIAMTGWMCMP